MTPESKLQKTARAKEFLLAFLDKASLFFAMYAVTVSLFWFETGMLEKALLFGLVAASVKTGIAKGHARLFRGRLQDEQPVCQSCQVSSAA